MKIGPITINNWGWWKYMWKSHDYYGIFRNKKEVVPGRWGIYVLGLEIGSRDPGNKFGVWLKNRGLWKW